MPVKHGRKINTRLTNDEIRMLKIIALEQGKTLTDLVTEVLRTYISNMVDEDEEEKEALDEDITYEEELGILEVNEE